MARECRIRGITNIQNMESFDDSPFCVQVVEWDRALSMQCVAADLGLAAGAGSSTSASPSYLAAVMGNVIAGTPTAGITLTATRSIVAGVIAKYDHVGTNNSTYPGAALIAEIGDRTTAADAAVLAVMGGDSGQATCPAAFRVDWQNSTATSAFTFGIDLQGGGTHDSYVSPRYTTADIRLGGRTTDDAVNSPGDDVLVFRFTGAPVNGASGTRAASAGLGSLLIRTDTGVLYINTGTLASPTWTIVGTQS